MERADSLRALLDSVFTAPEYRWVERPESLTLLRRWFRTLQQWLLDLDAREPALFRLLLAGMILLVIGIFLHAAWTFVRTVRAAQGGALGAVPDAPARRDREWFRKEAERLAATGRYAEAMQYDFLGLILALDAAALLRFHPGKTPGEYAREARLEPGAREAFQALVRTLYAAVFARRPTGPEEYAAWKRLAVPERYASA